MSEKKEADVGNWDEDFPKDKKENGTGIRIPFMKFDKPGDYTVRLVGNHVKFHRHWQPFTERVISHIDYKQDDPAWQKGFYPRETYAIHIIDRADGQLKILEKGRSLFKQFARYKEVNGVNPAGKDGTDWVITLEWPGGKKRQAKYQADYKNVPAPFTEEEIALIKENKAPLKDIYATTPLEKIKELWAALPDEAKIPPKRDENGRVVESSKEETNRSTTPPIEEKMPDSPAESGGDGDDDDLFGEESETSF